MNKFHLSAVLSLISVCVLFSCDDGYDDYSTSSSHVLSFSADTLFFDTLLTTVGTPTASFLIYNRNKKPLLISSISLTGAKGFRMNVPPAKIAADGSFYDVHIGGKDSLFVFVEATLEEQTENRPVLQVGQINFTTNHVQQKVVLHAYGQDVFHWKGQRIEVDTELNNEKPYLIYDSLVVAENAVLKIREGTIFYMKNNAFLKVYGSVESEGQIDNPVVFRGSRTDKWLSASYDKMPVQWGGIYFAASSYGNRFLYTHIRSGNYGMYFEKSDPELLKMKFTNSVLTNAHGILLNATDCYLEFENSEISNASAELAYLCGGRYSFIHCTLANYMPSWLGLTVNPRSIYLTNYGYEQGEVVEHPLIRADFINSVVLNRSSNITLSRIDEEKFPDTAFEYLFRNCLLKAELKKNAEDRYNLAESRVVDCIFYKATDAETSPDFIGVDTNTNQYDFDFRPGSQSALIDKGTPEVLRDPIFYFDRNGVPRLDGLPDIGAYEWTEPVTEE